MYLDQKHKSQQWIEEEKKRKSINREKRNASTRQESERLNNTLI